jgi:hypothetical protein
LRLRDGGERIQKVIRIEAGGEVALSHAVEAAGQVVIFAIAVNGDIGALNLTLLARM